ncbi:hypothetical protein J7L48_06625 [bacterium]|nr:hypothetical protein [bacterium]
MKLDKKTKMVLVIVLIFLMGLLVLIFNKDYRIEKNLKSNAHYYEFLGK